MEKAKLSEDIKRSMDLWRKGFEPLPQSYMDFHTELAKKDLEILKSKNIQILKEWVADDGWMDGMKVLWAEIRLPNGSYKKIHWHDGNQEFFECQESGASVPLKVERLVVVSESYK